MSVVDPSASTPSQDINQLKPRVRKVRLARLVRSVLFIYLSVSLIIFALQRRLIFPGASSQGTTATMVNPTKQQQIVNLKLADGTPIVAVYMPSRNIDASAAPTAIFFYGNAMSASDCESIMYMLARLGMNVVVPDYAGYGMSGGSASEKNFYETADAVYDWVKADASLKNTQVISVGWSIGSGVAVDLASRRKVDGLITLSAFTSIVDMARQIAWFLPNRLLVRHRFLNEDKIKSIRVPTLIIHGKNDVIIPWTMSQTLASKAGGPVTTLYTRADHNDMFEVEAANLSETISRWLTTSVITAAPSTRSSR